MWDVLLWADAPNYQPAMPGARPYRYAPAQKTSPVPPVVRMTNAELRQAISDTKAAWETWEKNLTKDIEREEPLHLRSPDRQRWQLTIADDGTIGRRKVP